MLCAFSAPASAQARFSWAVDTEGAFYLGDKSGGYYGADAVFGLLNKQDWFWGLGVGYKMAFISNSSYNPEYEKYTADDRPAYFDMLGFFGLPKTFKPHYASVFLNARHDWGEREFKPTVDCRAGVDICFSGGPGVSGAFLSVAAGYRYDLSDKTGAALKLFYERRASSYADDVNKSLLGIFHSIGLRLSYEF